MCDAIAAIVVVVVGNDAGGVVYSGRLVRNTVHIYLCRVYLHKVSERIIERKKKNQSEIHRQKEATILTATTKVKSMAK